MFSPRNLCFITFIVSVVFAHTPAYAEKVLLKQSGNHRLDLDLWLLHEKLGATELGSLVPGVGSHDIFKWRIVEIPDGMYVDDVLAAYAGHPAVEAVEPDALIQLEKAPNDPFFASSGSWRQQYKDLWGIHRVDLQRSWDEETGDPNIIVASIDTGVDRRHPDLEGNIWVNEDEIPDNGKDDDNNGYVDDYYGWDFFNQDRDPIDDHGHGTHTAGTIAAAGNNGRGVVGVVWSAKIMSLKFLSSSGSGTLSGAVEALKYAADNGARVLNNSWGGYGYYQSISDAVDYAHQKGIVTVSSAGNSNRDALDFTPANAPGSIAVAAIDAYDKKAGFSNYGYKIDVTAPGVDILSLRSSVSPMCPESSTVATYYCRVSGTSMSGPVVAGLAALILSHRPDMTPEQVRQALRMSTDDLGERGRDKMNGYGLPTGSKMFENADEDFLAPYIMSPYTASAHETWILPMMGYVDGSDFAEMYVMAAPGRESQDWIELFRSSKAPNRGKPGKIADLYLNELKTGIWRFKLLVVDSAGRAFEHEVFDISITIPQGEPPPPPSEDQEPPSVPKNLRSVSVEIDSVKIRWNASRDNVGVDAYAVWRNGQLLGKVPQDQLMYTDLTVEEDTTYSYRVQAIDEAGNESELSDRVVVMTPKPEPPPAEGPPPPKNVRVWRFDGIGAIIAWDLVPGAFAYAVVKDWVLIGWVYDPTYTFFDQDDTPSGHKYQIISVDEEGNPGEPSRPK